MAMFPVGFSVSLPIKIAQRVILRKGGRPGSGTAPGSFHGQSETQGMKAAVFESFGEPSEVLSVRDVPLPEPGPGEVRVRMIASPINPSDLLVVRGRYGVLPSLPSTPGFEGVGVVDKAGPGLLGRWVEGKRVAVINSAGGNWAEYAVIPARQARPIPADIPDEQAATFFVNPATVLAMVRHVLRRAQGRVAASIGRRLDSGEDDHQAGPARRLQDAQRRPPDARPRRN